MCAEGLAGDERRELTVARTERALQRLRVAGDGCCGVGRRGGEGERGKPVLLPDHICGVELGDDIVATPLGSLEFAALLLSR